MSFLFPCTVRTVWNLLGFRLADKGDNAKNFADNVSRSGFSRDPGVQVASEAALQGAYPSKPFANTATTVARTAIANVRATLVSTPPFAAPPLSCTVTVN